MDGIKGKKILFVSYAYPPVSSPGAMRIYHFANDFAALGADVTVLTCNNPYSSMMGDTLGNDKKIRVIKAKDLLDKSQYAGSSGQEKRKTIKVKLASAFVYPDRDFTWIPAAVNLNEINSSSFDFVVGTYPSVTNLVVAKYLSKKCGAKLVLDMRDLWTQDLSFQERPFFKRFLDGLLETWILKSAYKIVNVSEYNSSIMRDDVERKQNSATFHTVRNGFDYEKIKKARNGHLERSGKNSKFTLSYAGSFYSGERDPRDLFEVISMLRDEKVISENDFCFNIYGPSDEGILELIEGFGLSDFVRFSGSLQQEQLFERLIQSDCLFVVTRKGERAKGEMTTKVFEYLGLGKPIICQCGSGFEIESLLHVVDNARVSNFGDVPELKRVLSDLIALWHTSDLTDAPLSVSYSRKESSLELWNCLTK